MRTETTTRIKLVKDSISDLVLGEIIIYQDPKTKEGQKTIMLLTDLLKALIEPELQEEL